MTGRKLGLFGIVWLVAAWPEPAAAGTLSVSPIRLQLGDDGQAEVIRLSNLGGTSTLVQTSAFAWPDAATVDALEPTTEVLVVPPVFELGPDGSQIIRVALRSQPSPDKEQTYRLLITEVPTQFGNEQGAVSFAMQFSIPVFVTPDGAAPDPVWSLRQHADGMALVITNQGSAHIKFEGVQLLNGEGADPVLAIDGSEYVLAGQEHSWPLDLLATQLDGTLTLKAETNLGPLETTVSWPEG